MGGMAQLSSGEKAAPGDSDKKWKKALKKPPK